MIPSLEWWQAKAKEVPSPHEVRLTPLLTKKKKKKNDHLHLTKFGYEKLSLLFVNQLNSVLEKTHESPQEPHLAYSYKAISFTLNKRASTIIVCLQSNGIIY